MKKFIKIMLCCFMFVCLFACGSKEEVIDNKQVVIDALKKTNTLEFMDLDMDISMKFIGTSVDILVNSKLITKEGIPTAMSTTTSFMEQDILMSYVDGYIYMDAEGMKLKGAATVEQYMEYGDMDFSLDENMVLEVVKLEDGSYNVELNSETANDFPGFVEGSLGEIDSSEIKDITYNVKINDNGYVSDFKIVMDLSASVEGTSYDINTAIDCKYNNIGQAFEIAAPSDADSYEEVDFNQFMNAQ